MRGMGEVCWLRRGRAARKRSREIEKSFRKICDRAFLEIFRQALESIPYGSGESSRAEGRKRRVNTGGALHKSAQDKQRKSAEKAEKENPRGRGPSARLRASEPSPTKWPERG